MKGEKADNKRQFILEEAAKCFGKFGYEKTTLEDIGRVTNMNKATLYYYYKNKEEIFLAVVLAESERFITDLQAKVRGLEGFEQQIVSYFVERLGYYQKVVNLHQLSISTLRQVQPIFDALYQRVSQKEVLFIESLLAEAQSAGVVRTAEPLNAIANALVSIANALKHEAILQSKAIYSNEVDYTEVEIQTRYIIRLILNGLTK